MTAVAVETVRRFATTHVSDRWGWRRLTLAQQGRETFATRAEGERALAALSGPQGLRRVLSSTECATLAVSEVECWPGHFDPIRIVEGT